MKKINFLDTTLRDGAQTEGISFTVEDKLKIVRLLDQIGIQYIEAGWPGSNPKDIDFFKKVMNLTLSTSKIVAFGSTRRAKVSADKDKNLAAILETGVSAASIFGKTWDFHVKDALKVSLEENLEMIEDSVKFLKSQGMEVLFDAEHFFDGYKANKSYALKCLSAAENAGADVLVLCDTNGGTLPHEIEKIISDVRGKTKKPLGIHAHNDSDCAVANSLTAAHCGVVNVQGTINGYGERCGNANLCSIIPALQLKMKLDCIGAKEMEFLTELSRHVSEIANLPQSAHQPYVGRSAFAHKGGIHVSAVLKHPDTYEHVDPKLFGNERRVTVSELSGISNLLFKAKAYGINLKKDSPEVKKVLQVLKDMEHQGYSFEEGEASFELLLKRALKMFSPLFKLVEYKVNTTESAKEGFSVTAKIKLIVNGKSVESSATGDGPINALDQALRKAIKDTYPEIESVKLSDYKVRVLDSKSGTAAKVRVIVESQDESFSWGTVGVSTNVIEASWIALTDSIEYKLMKGK